MVLSVARWKDFSACIGYNQLKMFFTLIFSPLIPFLNPIEKSKGADLASFCLNNLIRLKAINELTRLRQQLMRKGACMRVLILGL